MTFDQSRVTSTDWSSYPILTFPDVPKLEIALIDRPHERPLGRRGFDGAGGGGARQCGVRRDRARLREVPFTPGRVKAAFAASV